MSEPQTPPEGEKKSNWYGGYRNAERRLQREMEVGRSKSQRRGQIFAASLSGAVAITSIVGLIMSSQGPGTAAKPSPDLKDLDRRLSGMAERVKALESSELLVNHSSGESNGLNERKLTVQLNALQDSVHRLDSAIANSPEEAVSVVLLKRDIQDLRKSQEGLASSVGREIDRVYDMTKWLFGLFLTMALSILTLAFAALSKTVQKEPIQEKKE